MNQHDSKVTIILDDLDQLILLRDVVNICLSKWSSQDNYGLSIESLIQLSKSLKIFYDYDPSLLKEMKTAYTNWKEANAPKCTCDGFTLQYEGRCVCGKQDSLETNEDKIFNLLKELFK